MDVTVKLSWSDILFWLQAFDESLNTISFVSVKEIVRISWGCEKSISCKENNTGVNSLILLYNTITKSIIY